MRRVVIESPYAGGTDAEIAVNVDYARRCLRDSLQRGEAPIASHLLYTQSGVLDDKDPAQRKQGITAGFVWGDLADATIVYVDRGISPGMAQGLLRAIGHRPVEVRWIASPESNFGLARGRAERDDQTVDRIVAHCEGVNKALAEQAAVDNAIQDADEALARR